MSTSTNELWLGYGNDVISFGNEIVSVIREYDPVQESEVMFQFSDLSFNPNRIALNAYTNPSWRRVSTNPNIWIFRDTTWKMYEFKQSLKNLNTTVTILDGNLSKSAIYGIFLGCTDLVRVEHLDLRPKERIGSAPETKYLAIYTFTECTNLTYANLYLDNQYDLAMLFTDCTNLEEAYFSGNLQNVKSLTGVFRRCNSIRVIPDMNVPKCTSTNGAFTSCWGMQTIPNIVLSNKCTDVESMFSDCVNVSSGILSYYQYLSNNGIGTSNHIQTFWHTGYNTTQGRRELYQIPADWKGEQL
jgi:hypothetical protein